MKRAGIILVALILIVSLSQCSTQKTTTEERASDTIPDTTSRGDTIPDTTM